MDEAWRCRKTDKITFASRLQNQAGNAAKDEIWMRAQNEIADQGANRMHLTE
jgi:hypothetical protein